MEDLIEVILRRVEFGSEASFEGVRHIDESLHFARLAARYHTDRAVHHAKRHAKKVGNLFRKRKVG